MSTLPTSGLHYGLPYADYAAWEAANFSKLKPILKTASKCKYEIAHPKPPTNAMILGSALHVAVLEPARFEGMFFICPPCKRNTTEGKAIWEEAVKQAKGKTILREGDDDCGEFQKLRGMAAAIRKMKSALPFIDGAGDNEVSLLWKDEETGLHCKARLDRLIREYAPLAGLPVIVEIKSARDASDWHFGKDVDAMNYDAQSASYRHAVRIATGKTPVHIFIVVENEPPFDCAVYMLDDKSLQTGLLKYRQMLSRYAACVKSGNWPGYEDKINVLSTPEYSHERNYEN